MVRRVEECSCCVVEIGLTDSSAAVDEEEEVAESSTEGSGGRVVAKCAWSGAGEEVGEVEEAEAETAASLSESLIISFCPSSMLVTTSSADLLLLSCCLESGAGEEEMREDGFCTPTGEDDDGTLRTAGDEAGGSLVASVDEHEHA